MVESGTTYSWRECQIFVFAPTGTFCLTGSSFFPHGNHFFLMLETYQKYITLIMTTSFLSLVVSLNLLGLSSAFVIPMTTTTTPHEIRSPNALNMVVRNRGLEVRRDGATPQGEEPQKLSSSISSAIYIVLSPIRFVQLSYRGRYDALHQSWFRWYFRRRLPLCSLY